VPLLLLLLLWALKQVACDERLQGDRGDVSGSEEQRCGNQIVASASTRSSPSRRSPGGAVEGFLRPPLAQPEAQVTPGNTY
jgi:hypothetical protein